MKLEKRFSAGLSFLTHYTYAKSLDVSSQVNEEMRDFYNPGLSKGRSLSDIRHRAVFSGTYELPFGRGKRYLSTGVASYVLGNWQTNTIINLQSGFGYDIGVGGDACNCAASSQTADQVGDPYSGAIQTRESGSTPRPLPLRRREGSAPAAGTFLMDPVRRLWIFRFSRIFRSRSACGCKSGVSFSICLTGSISASLETMCRTPATYGVIQSARDARIIQLSDATGVLDPGRLRPGGLQPP